MHDSDDIDALQTIIQSSFTDQDIRGITLDDPRFTWLRTALSKFHVTAETIGAAVDYLGAAEHNSLCLADTLAFIRHLSDYIVGLTSLALEDELKSAVSASITSGQYVLPLINRYGWGGEPPITLQQAGNQIGVTRERIRQVAERFEQYVRSSGCWMPTLGRTLGQLLPELPMEYGALGSYLHESKLSSLDTFNAKGLISAAGIFGNNANLTTVKRREFRVLALSGTHDGRTRINELKTMREVVVKLVNNQGIATIREVADRLDALGTPMDIDRIRESAGRLTEYILLDDTWITSRAFHSHNSLANRLMKLVALYPGTPVELVAIQLQRDTIRGYHAPPKAIRLFAQVHPDFELQNDHLYSRRNLAPKEVLSPGELEICMILSSRGALRYRQILESALSAGLTEVNVNRILDRSVFITRSGEKGTYRYTLLAPTAHIRDPLFANHGITTGPGNGPTDTAIDSREQAIDEPNDDGTLLLFGRNTKRVEEIAMKTVMAREIELGCNPIDISNENRGYDIESTGISTGIVRKIEVKGRVKGASTITVTRNEILAALRMPEEFILAIVEVDGDSGTPMYLKQPFVTMPDTTAISVNYEIDRLLRKPKRVVSHLIDAGDKSECSLAAE